jgi:hypothetical protein
MGEQPRRLGDRLQAGAGRHIHGVFGHVDVHARPDVARQPDHRLQGGGRKSEASMGTDEAVAAGTKKPLIFCQTGPRSVGSVAIGHLVTTPHPHAHLGTGGGDDIQRPVDGVGRTVVVDDAGRARFEGLQGSKHGRPADHLHIERPVEPPPDQLQDLAELRRHPRRRGHASGQGRIQVMVAANQARGRVQHFVNLDSCLMEDSA